MWIVAATIVLLFLSNVFMTFAWYGHLGGPGESTWNVLRFIGDLRHRPWFVAALVRWLIALVEYLFQVPANRIGSEVMSKAQLKILQEVISLSVFGMIAVWYWREPIGWNYLGAGLCILGAVFFVFRAPAAPHLATPVVVESQWKDSP